MTRLLIHVLLINCVVGLVLIAVFVNIVGRSGTGSRVTPHNILREQLESAQLSGPGDKPRESLETDYGVLQFAADAAVDEWETKTRRAARGRWLFYIAAGALVANGLLLLVLVQIGEQAEARAKGQTSSEEGTNA